MLRLSGPTPSWLQQGLRQEGRTPPQPQPSQPAHCPGYSAPLHCQPQGAEPVPQRPLATPSLASPTITHPATGLHLCPAAWRPAGRSQSQGPRCPPEGNLPSVSWGMGGGRPSGLQILTPIPFVPTPYPGDRHPVSPWGPGWNGTNPRRISGSQGPGDLL